jgi:putative transposase
LPRRTETYNHVWTYDYLLRRIGEVAEEYGITVIHVDEAYTSSKCPVHGEGCGKRIKRGLFKCTKSSTQTSLERITYS